MKISTMEGKFLNALTASTGTYYRSCRQSTAKESMLPGGSVVDLSRKGTQERLL